MNRHASLLTRQLLISALLLSIGLGCGGAKSGATSPSASASAYPVVGRFTPIYMLKQYEGESEPLIDMSASGGEGGSAAKTGDHDEPVLYWSDAQRSAHTIEVKGGLIIDSTGAPLDPKLDLPEHKERGGEAIYVMDVMGNIYYCFDAKYGRIHHSTLAGGQPVAAAGELVIVNGELISVSNESGHYRPPPSTIDLVLNRFKELGLKVEGVKRFELLPKKDAPPPERLKPRPQ